METAVDEGWGSGLVPRGCKSNSSDCRLTCIDKTCRQPVRPSKETFQSSCRPARQGASELYAKSFLDEQVNRTQRMIYATGIASEA